MLGIIMVVDISTMHIMYHNKLVWSYYIINLSDTEIQNIYNKECEG